MTVASSPTYQTSGIVNQAVGGFTGDGGACTITVGFKPMHVKLFNETDAIQHEWLKGMAATKSIKTAAAGTVTADTGSLIVDNGDGTITIAAAAAVNAKVYTYIVS